MNAKADSDKTAETPEEDPTSVRAIARRHGIDFSKIKDDPEYELEKGWRYADE